MSDRRTRPHATPTDAGISTAVPGTAARTTENHSTRDTPSAIIGVMFRHAFDLAASAVADAPKAAVAIVPIVVAVDGARS
ncbi:hypothetical protein [Streptomyces sp. V3I7]|uniref:hypothetical protein n=1 Tax=Streptomyces sp. V3I7 TaxID=3042278 RepID=UPI00277D3328|nr:hypothetical protein [Streptomyces sp. V3I7]MDQ0989632.1 hypothetical protein [Streptomyces sp. V3I7]